VLLEILGLLKNPMTTLGIEPATASKEVSLYLSLSIGLELGKAEFSGLVTPGVPCPAYEKMKLLLWQINIGGEWSYSSTILGFVTR
jgi:hypothetical protein